MIYLRPRVSDVYSSVCSLLSLLPVGMKSIKFYLLTILHHERFPPVTAVRYDLSRLLDPFPSDLLAS